MTKSLTTKQEILADHEKINGLLFFGKTHSLKMDMIVKLNMKQTQKHIHGLHLISGCMLMFVRL